MIVPTMKYAEIANEIDKDLVALYAYIEKALSVSKYRKIGMKHTKPVHFKPIYWESNRHNKYFVIPCTNGKKDLKKYGMLFYVWCYYKGEKGELNGVMIASSGAYCFYKNHLFMRYAERFFNDSTMEILDLMVEFATHNTFTVNMPFYSARKYTNSYIGKVEDGVILGTKSNGYMIYNTFIAEEMLKGIELKYGNDLQSQLDHLREVRQSEEYIQMKVIEAFKNKNKILRMAS